MYEVFTKLLNMSLTAGILVLIIIVLRLALKKAPKNYICILWALVALRLICPFSISSAFSAYNMLAQNTISGGQVEYFEYNGKTEKPKLTFEVPTLVNDDYSSDSVTVGTKTSDVYMPAAVCIWLFGVVVMAAYALISYAELRKEVKASVKKDENVYICDEINSPFILGVIRPEIYLPSGMGEEVRENAVAHEKAHIRRLDYIWKPLGFVLLSVYWFNPMMWIAYIFLCKDIEAACDEKVISQMNKERIASYSQALLACAAQRKMITACPVAFGETDVKGRIRNVLNYKKPAVWIICISIIVCIVVAVCFLTNPKEEKKSSEVAFGTYVKNNSNEDPRLYWSGLTINEDGTFTYHPSVISSYMGLGTWTVDGDYVIFSDIGMGDVRSEVFRYVDGHLYYAAAKSASNSMWNLDDGAEYVLKSDITIPDYIEKNETQEDSQEHNNGIDFGDKGYNDAGEEQIFALGYSSDNENIYLLRQYYKKNEYNNIALTTINENEKSSTEIQYDRKSGLKGIPVELYTVNGRVFASTQKHDSRGFLTGINVTEFLNDGTVTTFPDVYHVLEINNWIPEENYTVSEVSVRYEPATGYTYVLSPDKDKMIICDETGTIQKAFTGFNEKVKSKISFYSNTQLGFIIFSCEQKDEKTLFVYDNGEFEILY